MLTLALMQRREVLEELLMVVLTAMEGRSQSGGEDGIRGTILRLEANADVVCGDFREPDLLK